ncbi:hypothetical protein PF004_g874 [Phytophthora fragariae]|uniref:Uncharacterized protein n=1 Tax=Phytophthora fragariae TaxID=53985 RepID=A0A6G0PUK4_9STRA|nr:hypothetical protein PF004_g874 [Phytophthora fragariae]
MTKRTDSCLFITMVYILRSIASASAKWCSVCCDIMKNATTWKELMQSETPTTMTGYST